MRVGGLGSGIDVAGTIQQILELEGKRVEKLQDQQRDLNDKVTAWIEVKQDLTPLTRASDTLRWMDLWRRMSTTSSNPSVMTATAASNAPTGTYSIEVQQLARAHTIGSQQNLLTDGVSGDPVKSDTPLVNITGIESGHSFKIAGQTFNITSDTTLASLRNSINDAAEKMPEDDRVRASILDNRLVVERVNTGVVMDGAVERTIYDTLEDTNGVLATIGLSDPANELISAQNSIFYINGAEIERTANTALTDVMDGVTINLNGTTPFGTSETFTIDRDKEAIKEAIHAFIDAYNISAETNEFYGKFDTTDPSRPTPGALQNDFTMREIVYGLRRTVTQAMTTTHTAENSSYTYNGREGVMNSLQHIGIWTQGRENRLAIVDEDRLDAMLDQYPEKVEQLFRGVQNDDGTRAGGVGLDMYRTTRNYSSDLDGWIDVRIENIDDEVLRIDDRVERIVRELEARERMLWSQFGAMDEAIAKMQQGFEYLMSQLIT